MGFKWRQWAAQRRQYRQTAFTGGAYGTALIALCVSIFIHMDLVYIIQQAFGFHCVASLALLHQKQYISMLEAGCLKNAAARRLSTFLHFHLINVAWMDEWGCSPPTRKTKTHSICNTVEYDNIIWENKIVLVLKFSLDIKTYVHGYISIKWSDLHLKLFVLFYFIHSALALEINKVHKAKKKCTNFMVGYVVILVTSSDKMAVWNSNRTHEQLR